MKQWRHQLFYVINFFGSIQLWTVAHLRLLGRLMFCSWFFFFSARCVRSNESSRYCHGVRTFVGLSVRLGRACIVSMHCAHRPSTSFNIDTGRPFGRLLKISVPGTIFGKLVSSYAALSPHSIGPERAVSCHTTLKGPKQPCYSREAINSRMSIALWTSHLFLRRTVAARRVYYALQTVIFITQTMTFCLHSL